jgi:hypothetical protein
LRVTANSVILDKIPIIGAQERGDMPVSEDHFEKKNVFIVALIIGFVVVALSFVGLLRNLV